MSDKISVGMFDTAVGTFGAVVTERGLALLALPGEGDEGDGPPEAYMARWLARVLPDAEIVSDNARIQAVADALDAYLDGRARDFDLPLDLRGTPFQLAVWRHLTTIPYGETRSYAQVAAAIGRPSAVRAVGAANGANPVAVIVPCHRVVGSSGTLTGYGGGLPLKARLLELEGIRLHGQRVAQQTLPLPELAAASV